MTTSSVSFRFLGVDDNAINRMVFEKQVELAAKDTECPCICDCAASGPDAIELCTNNKYDKIFMDYNMPGMNGGVTARKIRDLDPHAHIVGCTATEDKTEIADCIDAGMEQVLPKTANVREILVHEIIESVPTPYRKTSLG